MEQLNLIQIMGVWTQIISLAISMKKQNIRLVDLKPVDNS